MAKIPVKVKEKINKFLNLLETNGIHVEKAYLYGSYATGKHNKWSDIDLAVVSNNFIGNRLEDNLNLVDYIFQAGWDISPLPFLPEDFEDSMFARDEIIKKRN